MPAPFSTSDLQRNAFWELDKGVFYDRNPRLIPPGGASFSSNLIASSGKLKPRPGLVSAYATGQTDPVNHLSRYSALDGSYALMRSQLDTGTGDVKIYAHNGTLWVDKTSGGAISASGSVDIYPTSVNFQGKWFYTPGDGELLQWDGGVGDVITVESTQSDPDKKPFEKPRLIAANDARLFMADCLEETGTDRVPYRIAWSDFLLPNTWRGIVGAGSSGYRDLGGESSPITALYAEGDTLLVFKRRAIYLGRLVGGAAVYDFRRIVRGPGCVTQGSLREWKNGILVWLGDDNIYMGRIGQPPQPVGDPIENWIRANCDRTELEKSRAVVDFDEDLYHLFVPDANGDVIKILTLHLKNGSWWTGEIANTGIEVSDAHALDVGVWQSEQLIASNNGEIYQISFSALDDAGTAFTTRWESGIIGGDILTQNRSEQVCIQTLRAFSESGSVSLSLEIGDGLDRFSAGGFAEQTQTFDAVQSPLYVSGRATGEHFKIVLAHNADDMADPAHIYGVGLGWMPKGDTR